jgi:hypothetical protein
MGSKQLKRFGAFVVAASLIAGCAGLTPRSPEEAVKERAQARWDALVRGDVKTAYEFFSPGSKQAMSLESYEGSIRRGFWKKAWVKGVKCETSERCTADIGIEYEFMGRRTPSGLVENWIKEGGTWWVVR